MKVTFEPGDGSFEVILEDKEPLPPEWNVLGVAVLREISPKTYRLIKDYEESLV
jgi:hypothetical protein